MKLLVCASEYYPCGAGIANVAYYVVRQLQNMGVDCTVCSPTGPDIKLGSSSLITKYGRLGLLYYWYQVSKYFKRRADDDGVTWLHNPLFLTRSPFKKSLMTMHVTSYGQTVHRIYPWRLHLYYKISAGLEKRSFAQANCDGVRFTAVSRQGLQDLKQMGIDSSKITYIPNGVDIERFRPRQNKKELRKRLNIPEERIILLSLGRLTEAKQPDKLIKIYSLIEKSLKNVVLVIAGDGELLQRTKRLAKQKGLNNVKFLGCVDHEKDVPDLYACSDFYIMTSKSEGQPLTLLEAMASGLPCIVSNIPSLSSVVQDARCGIIVDFSDEEKAASGIVSYLGQDYSEHTTNARKYAVSNLDWKIIASRYLEELEKL